MTPLRRPVRFRWRIGSCASAGCPLHHFGRRRRPLGGNVRSAGPPRARPSAEDVDVSVFQFTLGIPGLPDEQVPRILGVIGLAFLALNRAASIAVDAAQTRSEAVALALGITCVCLPWLEKRVNRARTSIADQSQRSMTGSRDVFYLQDGLGDDVRAELAWGSFAVLKHTNASFVLFASNGRVALARGAFKVAGLPRGIPSPGYPVDTVLAESYRMSECDRDLRAILARRGEGDCCDVAGRREIESEGLYAVAPFLAREIGSVVVAASEPGGLLVLGGRAEDAFSPGQTTWAANVALKMARNYEAPPAGKAAASGGETAASDEA